MLKEFIRPIYTWTHDLLYKMSSWNPLFKQTHGGQTIIKGHISTEHLENPALDDQLAQEFRSSGIPVTDYPIDITGYHQYMNEVQYPDNYYGGGGDPENNFTEKTLEHYVSTQFLSFKSDMVFVDIAACSSPFYKIVRNLYDTTNTYQQDLIFPKGIHGDQIGGWAHELSLPDGSVDAVTLHCSLEHFEGDSDRLFFVELSRVLKPGGRAVILPFYLAHTYTIHIDPAYNLLKLHRPEIDSEAQLRYCNWFQFFSRHYDLEALQKRILKPAPDLHLSLYRVTNFREVDSDCYLRWVGVFEKKPDYTDGH